MCETSKIYRLHGWKSFRLYSYTYKPKFNKVNTKYYGFHPKSHRCLQIYIYILIYILKSILSWGSGLLSGNIWRNLSSLMPQREVSTQVSMWSCLFSTLGGLSKNHVDICWRDCHFFFAHYVNKCNCIVLQYSFMTSVCGPCICDLLIIESDQCMIG